MASRGEAARTHKADVSYEGALAAAGATVHDSQHFGSYQGDWWALVTYEGETGYVHGYYGSCSGCDAIQGEFGYDFGEWQDGDGYILSDEEFGRFVDFGRSYLEDALYTQAKAEEVASEDLSWDMDAKEAVDWLKAHATHPAFGGPNP